MLALSFLLIIGMTLMVKGFDVHVPRGYIYFAMAFPVMVEMFNPRTRTRQTSPIKLHRKLEQGQNPV